MKKHAKTIAIVCLCSAALSLIVAYTQTSRASRANYSRIEEGMTYEEVCELLGRPPSYIGGRPWAFGACWRNPDLTSIDLTFKNGVLVEKQWTPAYEQLFLRGLDALETER
jgi:hypothetical protein